MTDSSDRPDDAQQGPTPDPRPEDRRDDADPDSVLTGFSWDDPSAGSQRPASSGSTAASAQPPAGDADPTGTPSYGSGPSSDVPTYGAPSSDQPSYGAPSSDQPSYGAPYGEAPQAPAQYPPAAPYPPAGGQPDPYAAGPSQAYGQPYGQQAPPYAAGGYGQSAQYTSTPQPYAYGPAPLSPEAEKARSSAVLWTILNGVSIVACGNLLAIAGVICAALAIGKAREDVQASRNLTKWSWILFAIGFALGALLIIGYIVFVIGVLGTAGMSGEF